MTNTIAEAIAQHITQLLEAKEFHAHHTSAGTTYKYVYYNPATTTTCSVNISMPIGYHQNQVKVYANISTPIPWGASTTQLSYMKSLNVDITNPNMLDKIEQYLNDIITQ